MREKEIRIGRLTLIPINDWTTLRTNWPNFRLLVVDVYARGYAASLYPFCGGGVAVLGLGFYWSWRRFTIAEEGDVSYGDDDEV